MYRNDGQDLDLASHELGGLSHILQNRDPK